MELMKRAITIAENQWPEMADAHMEVPIDYFSEPRRGGSRAGDVRDDTARPHRQLRDRRRK